MMRCASHDLEPGATRLSVALCASPHRDMSATAAPNPAHFQCFGTGAYVCSSLLGSPRCRYYAAVAAHLARLITAAGRHFCPAVPVLCAEYYRVVAVPLLRSWRCSEKRLSSRMCQKPSEDCTARRAPAHPRNLTLLSSAFRHAANRLAIVPETVAHLP